MTRHNRVALGLLITGVLLLSFGIAQSSSAATTSVNVVAVGDIACAPAYSTVTPTTCQQDATEKLAASLSPKYVFTLGDLVYDSGSLANLQAGYAPTWGKLKSITRPVPGNHETGSQGLTGYFQYFGARATPDEPTCISGCKGYYFFTTGSWLVVGLNSAYCSEHLGGCPDFSAQADWIRSVGASHSNKCILVMLHHPLWSYASSATPGALALYQAAQDIGADVVLAGHAHRYERFKPMLVDGTASAYGLTEYVIGTGGVNLQPVGKTAPPNRAAAISAFGVLKLSLNSGGWTSSFRNIDGTTQDKASGTCH